MASSLAFLKSKLTENDVPGASLQNKPIQGHSVCELRRWLKCRGQKTGGTKKDLVDRVEMCLKSGITQIDIAIDNGKWYEKLNQLDRASFMKHNHTEFPPIFPVNGWKKFPSEAIPKFFNYGIIYKHLVETAVITNESNTQSDEEEIQNFNTSKPLKRGRIYFKSGNVTNIESWSNNQIYCLKSLVMSSYANTNYTVMIMLDQNTGEVKDASCECVASAMGRCSHVSGLLFALEDYVIEFGYNPPSCTSQICKWNQGSSRKNPTTSYKRDYKGKICPEQKFTFHPYADSHKTEDPVQLNNSFLSTLQYTRACDANSPGMSSWELLLNFIYEDYEITLERKLILKDNVSQFRTNICFQFTEPNVIPGTTEQNRSEKWHRLRTILITASKCKDFIDLNPSKHFVLLKNLMYTNTVLNNKFVNHGLKHEEDAFREYTEKTGRPVSKTGLWVNPKYIGLGASPDGIILDRESNVHGILEIKCPYVLKDFHPTELDKLTSSQRNAFCCMINENGEMCLKRSHRYYYQVQMIMGVLEKKWCHFVIWTYKGIHIELIKFDQLFWGMIFPDLCKFHEMFICPEYFEMRIPRNLSPINI